MHLFWIDGLKQKTKELMLMFNHMHDRCDQPLIAVPGTEMSSRLFGLNSFSAVVALPPSTVLSMFCDLGPLAVAHINLAPGKPSDMK